MTDLIVKLAYKIESSKKYHIFRTFLFNILINSTTHAKKVFDLTIIFLVISTIAILIYEVNHKVPAILDYYEYAVVGIFILEWIGRFIVSFESHKQIIKDFEESQFLNIDYNLFHSITVITKEKLNYIFSISSIIDILAILPSYRPLRILRIFLLFRLFKILKYSNSLSMFTKIFIEKRMELSLLLMLYLLVIFFSATILYVYEGAGINPKVTSFTDAVYWAFITVSTIGYGDITPITEAGKSVTLILILTGYTVIAFFTSIITSSIHDKLSTIKENDTLIKIQKLHNYILVCGFGRSGHILVKNLLKEKYDVLVIDKEAHKFSTIKSKSLHIIEDDATDINLLRKIDINNNIKEIVVITNDDTINLSIILAIRSLNKNIKIVARCNRFKTRDKLRLAGANEIVELNQTASMVALGYIKSPIAYEAIDNILIDHKSAIMAEIEIFKNSPFIGKKLSDIQFDKFNINFLGLFRHQDQDNFIFNPDKENTIIDLKDFIIVIGHKRTIGDFKTYLQSNILLK